MGTFELFDHTADVGIAVRADSFEDLLATAARATFDQILEDWPTDVEVLTEVAARCASGLECDRSELLVVWLQELLYRFDTERLVPLTFEFYSVGPGEIRAGVGFGKFDPARHRTRLEVKAVTYHGLEVRRQADGTWSARFVLDV